jgi:hypothetical protein
MSVLIYLNSMQGRREGLQLGAIAPPWLLKKKKKINGTY